MEREFAYHLGNLKRDPESGIIEEHVLFNTYETHIDDYQKKRRKNDIKGDETSTLPMWSAEMLKLQ